MIKGKTTEKRREPTQKKETHTNESINYINSNRKYFFNEVFLRQYFFARSRKSASESTQMNNKTKNVLKIEKKFIILYSKQFLIHSIEEQLSK